MKLPDFLPDFSGLTGRLTEIFQFSGNDRRLVLIIAGGAAAVAAIAVIIIIAGSGALSRADSSDMEAGSSEYYGTDEPGERPFFSDFIFPENPLEESMTGTVRFREPTEQWTDEQVQQFWINPAGIADDILEKEADKAVRDIFADVP